MNSSLAKKLDTAAAVPARQPLVQVRGGKKAQSKILRYHHRPAGAVSPAAVIGFLMAAVLICMVLYSHIQLDRINEKQVEVSSQLETLQEEYQSLSAQYEQTFDLEAIETEMLDSGNMTHPSAEQQIYMDLSQPDNAETFQEENTPLQPLSSLVSQLGRQIQLFLNK